ncbi:hypothetical protein AAF712_005839 [Marasmius tenuissimus]|uniref:Ser-Thr-rich glycosyl-phosphatidyl-inositol-anchored membrane family-domain-containing protein n=1 Tax=Marasmius tenuissimus TaxID=585030 RepID=A0ABR3A0L6_9AGAR|nr:hypothetical protein PM082_006970 [Marasmius tenuissimus]
MQFTILAAALATLASLSNASPIGQRDVYVPPIISPDAYTEWVVGTVVNVTWDNSNPPTMIGNRASVQLNKANPSSIVGTLVRDFDLRTGWVEVTVPNVEPAEDYIITLFGDSGNRSPPFSIVANETETETKRSNPVARDVWNPRITSPTAGAEWVSGSTVTVTWDTSDAPELISNGGAVRLNKAGWGGQYLKESRSFDLRSGSVDVVVPDVEPGTDYSITLFGDSGNMSGDFTIVKADA